MKSRLLNFGLIVLLVCVCSCLPQSNASPPPLVEKGVIDLTQWDFEQDGPVNLNGEYEFYWHQLLGPQDFIHSRSALKPDFIFVPSIWNDFENQGTLLPGHGFATYRVRILLNGKHPHLAIKSLDVGTSVAMFVNGRRQTSIGVVGKTKATAKPGYRLDIIELHPAAESLDMVLQVANFSHRLGGAWETIVLGTRHQLQKSRELRITFDLFLFGSLFIMALYHLGLFSLNRRERAPLFFGLFCLVISLRLMTMGERQILLFFPDMDYQILIKLEYLSFYFAVPVFVEYFNSLFPDRFSKHIRRGSFFIGFLLGAAVIFFPVDIFSRTLVAYEVFTLFLFTYATAILVMVSLKKEIKAIIFLSGFSILFLLSINDMLHARDIIHTRYMVPFGLFLFIFSQAYLLSLKFSQAFVTIKRQSRELKKAEISLKKTNDGLEKRIKRRTAGILAANEILHKEIEERKQAQQITKEAKIAAEIANRAKSEFLANMSHEIRTPMNGIMGMVELIMETGLDEHQKNLITTMGREADALLGIINGILDFSKIEAGKLELEKIPFNLRTVFEELSATFAITAEKKGLEFISFFPPGLPERVLGDPGRLRQILVNLTGNALKFTPAGEIFTWAESFEEDGQNIKIKFCIKDTGIGIPKEQQDKIFDSFSQADGSFTRRYGGTGLGTSISKQLAAMMGGQIGFESDPSCGSTFWFTAFFQKEASVVDGENNLPDPVDFSYLKVLLVEDNPHSRTAFSEQLRFWGCVPMEAENGAQALCLLDNVHTSGQLFDLILCDFQMPGMDGAQLIQKIKDTQGFNRIPIVLLLAAGMTRKNEICRELGIQGYIVKPFKQDELKSALVSIQHNQLIINNEIGCPGPLKHQSVLDAGRQKIHVLLVEDYPTNQLIAVKYLTDSGFQVTLAKNGQEAVDLFGKGKFSLILMDIQMPFMDGYEATRQIRELEKGGQDPLQKNPDRFAVSGRTPIIAMTAHAIKGYIKKCSDAGMEDYITKPFKKKNLIKMVEKWTIQNETSGVQPGTDEPDPILFHEGVDSQAPLDFGKAIDEFENDTDFFMEVLNEFIRIVEQQIPKIQRATTDLDFNAVRAYAHGIRGGAANLTAMALSDIAAALEQSGESGNLSQAVLLCRELNEAFLQLKKYAATL